MITDEMVERAAQAYVDAIHDDIRANGWQPLWTWETWLEENKERERRRIRKALEAALKGIIPDVQRLKKLEAVAEAAREYLGKCICVECVRRDAVSSDDEMDYCEPCLHQKLEEAVKALERGE